MVTNPNEIKKREPLLTDIFFRTQVELSDNMRDDFRCNGLMLVWLSA